MHIVTIYTATLTLLQFAKSLAKRFDWNLRNIFRSKIFEKTASGCVYRMKIADV